MNINAQYELNSIKNELSSIISELDNIAGEIRREFSNIGNEQCASCISRVADTYRTVKRRLDNIDTSKVTEEFAAAHSEM